MRPTSFDIDVLRSFVCGVEAGSFAVAADKLARSTSAISAQLKKLESQVGAPLMRKAGRGLALTDVGEQLLDYARRLISLNDEAVLAVAERSLQGWVRFGLQEDLAEFLPAVLGQFARAHPQVRVEARVARNAELLSRLDSGALDMAVVWGEGGGRRSESLAELPMRWIGAARGGLDCKRGSAEPLPLILFDSPCPFHSVATAALERDGTAWRVAFTSSSLAGLAAATEAGLGYTVRTRLGLQPGTRLLDEQALGLPTLPSITLSLRHGQGQSSALVERLAKIVGDAIRLHLG
ncbi:MAG: LysR substrate-binding domain-containing protein [Janthinobacterium lividum]